MDIETGQQILGKAVGEEEPVETEEKRGVGPDIVIEEGGGG